MDLNIGVNKAKFTHVKTSNLMTSWTENIMKNKMILSMDMIGIRGIDTRNKIHQISIVNKKGIFEGDRWVEHAGESKLI